MNKRDEALEQARSALVYARISNEPQQIAALFRGFEALIEAVTLSELDALKEVAARLTQGSRV